jgi:hypothetical protein
MSHVAELLDSIAPPRERAGDWSRVLRDAGVAPRPRSRRLSFRLGAVAAAAAAIAVAVAAWPAGGPGPTVVERALAALGEGRVLHFVYETDPPKALVDLRTGQRTEVRAEHEVWFDPQAGLRETERFDGVVQFDVFLATGEVSEHARALYAGLGEGYRDALESGRATVVGEDVVDGTPVYWIRTEQGPETHDVAVSRDTYAPAYIRIEQNGTTALTRIVSYETLEAGSAPLDGAPPTGADPGLGTYGPAAELAGGAALLGAEPVWAGESVHGFPLESVRELRLPAEGGEVTGLSLAYGTPGSPHVEISQAAEIVDGLTMLAGVRGYVPPEGSALVAGSMALLRSNGLVVAIHAPDEEMALAVAGLLQPYDG